MQRNCLSFVQANILSNRAITLPLRVGITFAALAWIYSRLDWAQFSRVALIPDLASLFAMLFAALVFAMLGGIKVWVLLRALARVSLGKTIAYFFLASAIGAFTPAALGDFSIAAFLQRERVPVYQGLSAMLVDRVVSVSVYLLLFTPLTIFLLVDASALWWLPIAALALILFAALGNASARARQFFRVRVLQRYMPALENFARAVSDLLRAYPRHLAANVALAVARSVVGGSVVFFAIFATGAHPPIFVTVVATNALAIINLFPISIGGFGIYEGGGIVLFELLGLNSADVFAGLLYQRVYIIFSSLLILAISAALATRQAKEQPI